MSAVEGWGTRHGCLVGKQFWRCNMKLPGFNAEASVYTTTRHYYAGTASVADYGGVYPAQQVCPPWCVAACKGGCRGDGLSQTYCAKLCQYDCGAYGTGTPVSCGPCVGNLQTCTLCGGDSVTRGCTSLVCDPGLTNCGGTCADLTSNPSNCGACGNSCATGFCCDGTCGTDCGGGICCQGGVCCNTAIGIFCCDNKCNHSWLGNYCT